MSVTVLTLTKKTADNCANNPHRKIPAVAVAIVVGVARTARDAPAGNFYLWHSDDPRRTRRCTGAEEEAATEEKESGCRTVP